MDDALGTIEVPDQVVEKYLYGHCMDLATAIHRKRGWEIHVALEPCDYPGAGDTLTVDGLIGMLGEKSTWPYIAHAWCVHPETGDYHDIDGATHPDNFAWAGHIKGIDEDALRRLVDISAQRIVTREDWDASVAEAAQVLKQYPVDAAPPAVRRFASAAPHP
jgi:hypothetical protein